MCEAHKIRIPVTPYCDSWWLVFTAKCQSVAQWNPVAPKDREGDFLKYLLQKTKLNMVGGNDIWCYLFSFFMPVTWILACKLQRGVRPQIPQCLHPAAIQSVWALHSYHFKAQKKQAGSLLGDPFFWVTYLDYSNFLFLILFFKYSFWK